MRCLACALAPAFMPGCFSRYSASLSQRGGKDPGLPAPPSLWGRGAGGEDLLPVRLFVLVGAFVHQHVGAILLDFTEHRRDLDDPCARAKLHRPDTLRRPPRL